MASYAAGVTQPSLMFFITGHFVSVWRPAGAALEPELRRHDVVARAHLNGIATRARDEVSSRGLRWDVQAEVSSRSTSLFITFRQSFGISQAGGPLSILSAVWWGGFRCSHSRALKRRRRHTRARSGGAVLAGITGIAGTFRELRRLPQTLRYLLAYMLYNDGIQTVISIASVVLAQELFVAKGKPVNDAFLIGLVLMIQIVAFAGALIFERIAAAIGAKRAIVVSVVIWIGIVVMRGCWRPKRRPGMGAAVGFVLMARKGRLATR